MSYHEYQREDVQLRMWAMEKSIDVLSQMADGTNVVRLANLIHDYASAGEVPKK